MMEYNNRVFSSYEHIREIAPEYYASLQLQEEMVQQRKRLGPLFYDLKTSSEKEPICLNNKSQKG